MKWKPNWVELVNDWGFVGLHQYVDISYIVYYDLSYNFAKNNFADSMSKDNVSHENNWSACDTDSVW